MHVHRHELLLDPTAETADSLLREGESGSYDASPAESIGLRVGGPLAVYSLLFDNATDKQLDIVVRNLLADLMHLCDLFNEPLFPFDALLDEARLRYEGDLAAEAAS